MKAENASQHAPRVSVVLPVHNGERFLRQALDSVLSQIFTDFELLVVDDGSSDATPAILAACVDPRLIVLRNDPNQGLIFSLNRGVEAARGVYVARMDADDVCHPERFARQVAFLDAHPEIALIGTWVDLVDERGQRFASWRMPSDPAVLHTELLDYCCFCHPSVMFRRDSVIEAGGYAPKSLHAEDYDLWLRMSDRQALANLPETLLDYRMHGNQVSVSKIEIQRQSADQARAAAIRRRGLPQEVARKFQPGLWQRLSAGGHSLGWEYKKWMNLFEQMGEPAKAEALALRGVLISPFSAGLLATAGRGLFNKVVTRDFRRAIRWYFQRLLSLLGRR